MWSFSVFSRCTPIQSTAAEDKNDTTAVTVTSRPEQNAENHLLFFESNINENLLGKFRHANETGTYSGNVENLGLFSFWQKIFKLSAISTILTIFNFLKLKAYLPT